MQAHVGLNINAILFRKTFARGLFDRHVVFSQYVQRVLKNFLSKI